VIGEDDRPLPVLIKEAEKKVENVRKCVVVLISLFLQVASLCLPNPTALSLGTCS
jgi:hypothetical protein